MITIVLGKPGTGKSYHTVRYIVKYLTTLSRKKTIDRKIYTNLSINVEALQRYFDHNHINIEVSEVLVLLNSDFLKYDEKYLERGEQRIVKRGNKEFLEIDPASRAFFWNRFPDNALIVIDEIQKYLSNIKEVGDSEEQSLVEYFSLHRHKRHDWIFITQNLMSLSISVRRVSEKVVETLNSKQLTLPFPLSIPLRDIQTLLLGFGIQNQIYRVREGRLDGSYKVCYDGPVEPVVMKQEIFNLYQTHTLLADSDSVGVSSDSEIPFDLGCGAWRRAILWFVKKHWFHLTAKLCCIVFALYLVNCLFNFLKSPDWIHILGGSVADSQQSVNTSSDDIGSSVDNIDKTETNENNKIVLNDDFNERDTIMTPIISRAVLNDVVIENGVPIGVGSMTVDGRIIKDISPRYGVVYAEPVQYYLRLLDEPARFRRWLRFVNQYDEVVSEDF